MRNLSKVISTGFIALLSCGQIMAAEHEIKMLNSGADGVMPFEPGFLNVAVGDTVKFIATDRGHNSVSTLVPKGGPSWKGAFDEEIVVKLDTEGVYIYQCDPHVPMAMLGVIQVGEAVNLSEAQKAAKDLSAKFVMNKDRLDKYMAQVK